MSRVEFVEWRELPELHVPKWWDRPRWWLVRLLGGVSPSDTVKVTRIPIDGDTFVDRLYRQSTELFKTFRREPTTLLIGGEDYERLMCSKAVREAFSFMSSFNYGRHEVYGLKVHVIPWMRGIVVMPKMPYDAEGEQT